MLDKNIFICLSKGRGFTSFLIRWFSALIVRREEMDKDNLSNFACIIMSILSLFGVSQYADIKVKFNHSFLIYKSNDFNQWFSIDIIENGIILQPAYKSFNRCDIIKVIKPEFDLNKGIIKTSKFFGNEYDYPGVLGAIYSIIKYVFTGHYDEDIRNSPKRFVCSEYVVTAIKESGVDLGNPMAIYPNLLSKLTEEDNRFTTIVEKKNLTIDYLTMALANKTGVI